MAPTRGSALLRAEWAGDSLERTTLAELTERSAFVVTERLPPVGTRVDIAVAFADVVRVELSGVVTHVHLSLDPGSPAGFGVELDQDERGRAALAKLAHATRVRTDARRRAIRVLQVERNRMLRDMFAYALTRFFDARAVVPELTQAGDFTSTLAELAKRPHVIVVDHDLAPDGKGAELVVRARALLGDAPWIVGVGVGGAEMRTSMFDAGVDVYVRKPIVLPNLLFSIDLLSQVEARDAVGAA